MIKRSECGGQRKLYQIDLGWAKSDFAESTRPILLIFWAHEFSA
jgi:hypothetical protein